LVPLKHDADTAAIETFAFVLEQLRAAGKALKDANRRADRLRLSQDAQGWTNVALRYAKELGMTPKARGELGLDLVRAGAMADRDFDLKRLTEGQRTKLAELLAIAEGNKSRRPCRASCRGVRKPLAQGSNKPRTPIPLHVRLAYVRGRPQPRAHRRLRGHSSAYMTDRYRHLLEGHEAEAAKLLDEYLVRADTAARVAHVAE
jgi:hypothetical protein